MSGQEEVWSCAWRTQQLMPSKERQLPDIRWWRRHVVVSPSGSPVWCPQCDGRQHRTWDWLCPAQQDEQVALLWMQWTGACKDCVSQVLKKQSFPEWRRRWLHACEHPERMSFPDNVRLSCWALNRRSVLEDLDVCVSKFASDVANVTGVISGVSWVPDGVSLIRLIHGKQSWMVTSANWFSHAWSFASGYFFVFQSNNWGILSRTSLKCHIHFGSVQSWQLLFANNPKGLWLLAQCTASNACQMGSLMHDNVSCCTCEFSFCCQHFVWLKQESGLAWSGLRCVQWPNWLLQDFAKAFVWADGSALPNDCWTWLWAMAKKNDLCRPNCGCMFKHKLK